MLSKLLLLSALVLSSALATTPGSVWFIELNGPIGPAAADHVVRSLEAAQAEEAELVVLRIDTPGGLDQSMRDIIHSILASRVPVAGFVAPQGSRAASAGTYILYACHIAAMAPATNLGAATPIQIGGSTPLPSATPTREKGTGDAGSEAEKNAAPLESSPDALHSKMVNDAQAYIRSLAELRGRNAEWAVKAVTEAATLTASEALKLNVIDLIAEDDAALLEVLDGRTVSMPSGDKVLHTKDAEIHLVVADWRNEFLRVITNPSVAYVLLLIGVYGLFLEFSHPGTAIGGIVGGICLLLALYALQLLPISYSALALMLFGLGLMAAEAFTPSFGVLGVGGIAAFIIGSIMLMDTDVPGFQIALPIILALAVVSSGLLITVLTLLKKSRKKPPVIGTVTMTGQTAEVVDISKSLPLVRLNGELWRAQCTTPLEIGDRVHVINVSGLVLEVRKEK